MKTKSCLMYEVIDETVKVMRFDIDKKTLMGYMTIYNDVGLVQQRTEYFLSDEDEWIDLEHEIGKLELERIFGKVRRLEYK